MLGVVLLLTAIGTPDITSAAEVNHPNIVLIFTDDMGWGDLPNFTPESKIKTPNITRLVAEGTKFDDFYVAQAVCTASRAALMTGCYANRVGLEGALNHTSPTGIAPEEELLPELLTKVGYATGMFGKWHLGLPPFFAPSKNGFHEWPCFFLVDYFFWCAEVNKSFDKAW